MKFLSSSIALEISLILSDTYESSSLLFSLSCITSVNLSKSSDIELMELLMRSLPASVSPPSESVETKLSILLSREVLCLFNFSMSLSQFWDALTHSARISSNDSHTLVCSSKTFLRASRVMSSSSVSLIRDTGLLQSLCLLMR